MTSTFDPKDVLRKAGYRATPGRIKILQALAKEKKPLSVVHLQKKLGKTELNEVTLYRALEALTQSGVVRRVDLGHDHAHYELVGTHHHHLVCTNCGALEDVRPYHEETLEQHVLKQSRRFKSIYSHNLEFFGSCKTCAK